MKSIDSLGVIFVDDEKHILDGIKREMKKARPKWRLFYANAALDAIDVINNNINDIDVLVCDIKMPILSGIDVLRIAKQAYPRLLRIALSGQLDVYTLLDSDKISHLHICKPISSAKLSDKIVEAYWSRKPPKIAT